MATHLESRIDASGIQKFFDTTDSLEPKAVGVQVLVMIILSILTIITFNILRPNNKIIYEPKVKYHATDKHPPRISETFCGWITPLLHNHEAELLKKIGVDAVTFLRFLHLMKWLFTLTAVVVCGGLIPIDFLYTVSIKPPGYDFLTATTIRDVKGVRLYAHIVAEYLITLFLVVLVHHHWRNMYKVRNEWFRSPQYQRLLHARTLCITHIPERLQSDAGIYKIFSGMQLPSTVTSVHIGRDVGELPELIKQHNKVVEELEQIVANHLSDENNLNERPTIRLGRCCGLGGRREDAITFYTTRLKHTSAAVEQYRAQLDMRQAENFGFATIDSIPSAHAAARELKGRHPKGLTIKLAPNSKDIIWKNIGLSKANRRFRRLTGFILLLFFCFLSLIPLFTIASLANLNAIAASGYIPFLQRWAISSPISYTLVSGIVPPTIANIFGHFLPPIMRWLSKYMGAITHSSLDRVFIARYFAFLFISQLIFFTVIGVLFQSILEIVVAIQRDGAGLKVVFDNIDKLPKRITSTYVDQSSFWLKWFPLRGFLLIFDLSQVSTLLWISWSTRAFGRTPREMRESSKPPVFAYAIHYSILLFMGMIGLLFAPVAPLVSLAAAVVFWLCSWVYKYQLMFKFVTRVESGGRSWNVVINRLIFSGILMQIVMLFTIGFQSQFRSLQFLATIPPIPFTLLFKYYITKRFADDFQYYIPRYEERSRSIIHSEDADISGNKLEERYRNPALETSLFKPIVNSKAMSLLRKIYMDRTHRGFPDRTRAIRKNFRKELSPDTDETVEGIVFIPVNEDELEYDPILYRQDREEVDCDFDSVNETSSTDSPSFNQDSRTGFDNAHVIPALTREHGHEIHLSSTMHPGNLLSEFIHAPRDVPTRRHERGSSPTHQLPHRLVLGHESSFSMQPHSPSQTAEPQRVHRGKRSNRERQFVDHSPVARGQNPSGLSHGQRTSMRGSGNHDTNMNHPQNPNRQSQTACTYQLSRDQPNRPRGYHYDMNSHP